MTDKTAKLVAKLSAKQRRAILLTVRLLRAGKEDGLDIKPLKGHKYTYRARVGDYRIIYLRKDGVFTQVAILKRDDKTYHDFK